MKRIGTIENGFGSKRLQNAVIDLTKAASKRNLTMNTTEFIRRYADAWNGHDTDAFLAVYTKEGTYSNPDTYPGIGGEALAAYLKGLWTAFPDFSVEFLIASEIEPGLVADHWRMRGTNTGRASSIPRRAFVFPTSDNHKV
jgi:hypothetical protein